MIISLSILNINSEDRKNKISDFSVLDNWIHFDVMDGKFVENKTFAYEVVGEVNGYCSLFKDVHLMTYNPSCHLRAYKESGADQITFQYESVEKSQIMPLINEIKGLNMKVGISVKPNTNIEEIKEYLPYLDLVLVMSVEPGKGGQKFMDSSLDKIRYLKDIRGSNCYLISVDGGINNETSKIVKQAGADVVVVGTYLTKEKITEDKIKELI